MTTFSSSTFDDAVHQFDHALFHDGRLARSNQVELGRIDIHADDLKHKRRALVAIHEQAVDRYSSIKKDSGGGQDSLFDDVMGGGDAGDVGPIFDMTVAVPDIDRALDEAPAKTAFWNAFKAVGPWWAALPPY